jgi:hypothetical protein
MIIEKKERGLRFFLIKMVKFECFFGPAGLSEEFQREGVGPTYEISKYEKIYLYLILVVDRDKNS